MLNPASLQVNVNHHLTIHHNRFSRCGDGTRVSSILDELTTISMRSATQILFLTHFERIFFSLLSYRANRIGIVRELLSLIILRVFTYLIWIFHLWIYHTQSSLRLSCLSITSLLLSISLSPLPPPSKSISISISSSFHCTPRGWSQGLTHTANAPHWNYTHNSRLTYSSPV